MDGLLTRAWRSLSAPAEDPRSSLPEVHERQLSVLAAVRRARTSLRETHDGLDVRAAAIRRRLPQLDQHAREALANHRDDLARIAATYRELAAVELARLERQAAEIADEERRLSLLDERLTGEISAFHEREDLLAARRSAATAQARINESLTSAASQLADLDAVLEQTEATTEQAEARATAISRLLSDGVLDDPARVLDGLVERRAPGGDVSAAVEERLAALAEEVSVELPAEGQDERCC
jgi:phage shock protein A